MLKMSSRKGFFNVRFHTAEKKDDELRSVGTRPLGFRSVGRPRSLDPNEKDFNNDEAAARFYVHNIFQGDGRLPVRGMTSVHEPEVVPDMHFLGVQDSSLTRTKLVEFEQTSSAIPVFGTRVVVELDQNRELVSLDAEVAEIRGVSAIASISQSEALQKIAEKTHVPVESMAGLEPPQLVFYHDDEQDSWHLVYLFKNIPAAPADFLESIAQSQSIGHGLGPSPRLRHPRLNYLVDAHSGQILLYYSAMPMLLDIPTECTGIDEDNSLQNFWGRRNQNSFELHDPLRAIQTYDLRLSDLEPAAVPGSAAFPVQPVQNTNNNWNAINRAAVSAHINAMRVFDFYKSVLKRDGIDDKGMDLVSIVNCTYPREQSPPEWSNAVWYENKMWYGQQKDDAGSLRSFSRFLDVIAHELTHGVTQFTSDLQYYGESGALNESFSDIFAIIIKNWIMKGEDSDVNSWDWQIGPGLGSRGLPLRDLSNPKRTGDPDHMDNYVKTGLDYGGVHANSNIHNKAAYNLLTAKDPQGERVFSPDDIAILYYVCLTRLNPLATFSKTLSVLLDVASTFYAGAPDLQARLKYIRDAYNGVGIREP
jgi:bacillolysin